MSYRIIIGDVLDRLRELPDESVNCVVTSPPYWGLRDYGVAGQIGMEATPQEFIAKLTTVFREVRRVLRSDGTCWMNMGDSYSNSGLTGGKRVSEERGQLSYRGAQSSGRITFPGLKPKDLIGMPWRLAFALQDDGWYLRQDIIWSKPNPMPESVTDRCTKAHEYIFLLTKSARYYYDAEAIKEKVSGAAHDRGDGINPKAHGANSRMNVDRDPAHLKNPKSKQNASFSGAVNELVSMRNKRSVWEIATEPFPEAHFATFPTKLVEPCILAATSEKGCCEGCGAPWVRLVERTRSNESGSGRSGNAPEGKLAGGTQVREDHDTRNGPTVSSTTTGWEPSCSCAAGVVGCTVLDPFNGSGTTGLVALANRCNYIGIELNPDYAAMSERRLASASAQEVMAFA